MTATEVPWLDLIGMGDDGPASLTPAVRARLEAAEVVVASDRLHARCPDLAADRVRWPTPFDALIDRIAAQRGRRLAVLATGDPLWFSVGTKIVAQFGAAAVRVHPQVSAFQLAAGRLGWSLEEVITLTAHGRPLEQILPHVAPGARLLVLGGGPDTPRGAAQLLADRGYGESVLTALAHLGGDEEAEVTGLAAGWTAPVPPFHVLAVDCVADADAQLLARVPGLPDEAFAHDGQITKREVRAVTLAKLMPVPGALLWDVGAGCGSVAVEWMRAARDARAIAIETRGDRRELIAENARALGVPGLEIIAGQAPAVCAGLPAPDAVFLGGGLSWDLAERARAALRPLGRLVANAVTLDGEALLAELQARFGGELTRLAVARAAPLGGHRGWAPLRPVTQWSLMKR